MDGTRLAAFLCRQRWRREERPRSRRALRANALYLRRFDDQGNINLPIPVQIVAFRNGKELRQFAPLFKGQPIELAGLFQQGSDRNFILPDMAVENPWTVVFHECAHQLMNGNLQGGFDPWFQEGFAEYFSSVEVDNCRRASVVSLSVISL
jgi:hypothetical protein